MTTRSAPGLERIGAALDEAIEAPRQRATPPATTPTGRTRSRGCGRRPSAPRRWRPAGRGHARQAAPGLARGPHRGATAALGAALDELLEVAAGARDAVGERAAAIERRMLGEGDAEDVTAQLRACSRRRPSCRRSLRAAGEAVTEAEVRAPTCATAATRRPPSSSGSRAMLGREVEAGDGGARRREREEIERKLERLARRREALGPVNPLAEREYEEALEHVESSTSSAPTSRPRSPSSTGLIRETDRKIHDGVRGDLRGDPAELRGAGRAPLPGRPRPPAPRQRQRAPPVLGGARPNDGEPSGRPGGPGRGRGGRRGRRGRRRGFSRRALRSRSPRRARRPGGSRCSRAARRRWSRWRSCSPSSSPARRRSTSSTRSRPRSTTPTSTASCSWSTASPTAPSSSSSPTRSARWTRPTSSTASHGQGRRHEGRSRARLDDDADRRSARRAEAA